MCRQPPNRWANSDEAWPKSLQGVYLPHPDELTLVGAPRPMRQVWKKLPMQPAVTAE